MQPHGPSAAAMNFYEPSPILTAWRKLYAFWTVGQHREAPALTLPEEAHRICLAYRAGLADRRLQTKLPALWRIEKTGVRIGRQAWSLRAAQLPGPIQPIAHVGFGIGLTERTRFHPDEFLRQTEDLSEPAYQHWAWESAGAVYEATQHPLVRRLLGLADNPLPLRARYMDAFRAAGPEIFGRVSRGYGRLVYFDSLDVRATMRRLWGLADQLDISQAVQGAAFSCAMVNHREFGRIIRTVPHDVLIDFIPDWRLGLQTAVDFLDLGFPGGWDE